MKSIAFAVLIMSYAAHIIGTQSSYAQQTKTLPGYIIAEREIIDGGAAKSFAAYIGPTLKAFNGRAIVRGGKAEAVQAHHPRASSYCYSKTLRWRGIG